MLLAWPAAHTDWRDTLDEAQGCYRALISSIAEREPVILIVPPDDTATVAAALPSTRWPVTLLPLPYDDTWVRDTGPLTAASPAGACCWLDFRFDGWGGRFDGRRDDALAGRLHDDPRFAHLPLRRFDWVLEGGAIDTDGAGALLTTTRCLTTRLPDWPRALLEARLREALGVERILWLDDGELAGDDTDGHVDTLARFADPRTIVHQACADRSDEHYEPLARLAEGLAALTTATGEPFRLLPLPLPAPRYGPDGRRLAAGYANFLIVNGAVLMPTYGVPQDDEAAAVLAQAFPDRAVDRVDCRPLIRQGGSLHCATMQLPRGVMAA